MELSDKDSSSTSLSDGTTDPEPEDTSSNESKAENSVEDQKMPAKLFPIFQRNFKPESNPLRDIQLAFTESCTAPPAKRLRRSLLGKTETPGMSQMIIDAGQKRIGPRHCETCGLFFSPGDFQDEEVHRMYHNQYQNMFSIQIWKNANILTPFLNGGFVVWIQGDKDSKGTPKRLKDFLEWVDSEVGAGTEPIERSSSRRTFIYVFPTKRNNVKRILGCAVMEVINPNSVAAYRLQPPEKNQIDQNQNNDVKDASNKSAIDEVAEVSIMVGITRLWTDPIFRKKQIATRLCEAIRFNSGITCCVVPLDKLGILEPSEDGKAFMYRYTKGTGAHYTYKLPSFEI